MCGSHKCLIVTVLTRSELFDLETELKAWVINVESRHPGPCGDVPVFISYIIRFV